MRLQLNLIQINSQFPIRNLLALVLGRRNTPAHPALTVITFFSRTSLRTGSAGILPDEQRLRLVGEDAADDARAIGRVAALAAREDLGRSDLDPRPLVVSERRDRRRVDVFAESAVEDCGRALRTRMRRKETKRKRDRTGSGSGGVWKNRFDGWCGWIAYHGTCFRCGVQAEITHGLEGVWPRQSIRPLWIGQDARAVVDRRDFAWRRNETRTRGLALVRARVQTERRTPRIVGTVHARHSPCKVGFPSSRIRFTPVQISSPSPSSPAAVWFTMTEPKAAKGHGEVSYRASMARRIQYSRVESATGSSSERTVSASESGCERAVTSSRERRRNPRRKGEGSEGSEDIVAPGIRVSRAVESDRRAGWM